MKAANVSASRKNQEKERMGDNCGKNYNNSANTETEGLLLFEKAK